MTDCSKLRAHGLRVHRVGSMPRGHVAGDVHAGCGPPREKLCAPLPAPEEHGRAATLWPFLLLIQLWRASYGGRAPPKNSTSLVPAKAAAGGPSFLARPDSDSFLRVDALQIRARARLIIRIAQESFLNGFLTFFI